MRSIIACGHCSARSQRHRARTGIRVAVLRLISPPQATDPRPRWSKSIHPTGRADRLSRRHAAAPRPWRSRFSGRRTADMRLRLASASPDLDAQPASPNAEYRTGRQSRRRSVARRSLPGAVHLGAGQRHSGSILCQSDLAGEPAEAPTTSARRARRALRNSCRRSPPKKASTIRSIRCRRCRPRRACCASCAGIRQSRSCRRGLQCRPGPRRQMARAPRQTCRAKRAITLSASPACRSMRGGPCAVSNDALDFRPAPALPQHAGLRQCRAGTAGANRSKDRAGQTRRRRHHRRDRRHAGRRRPMPRVPSHKAESKSAIAGDKHEARRAPRGEPRRPALATAAKHEGGKHEVEHHAARRARKAPRLEISDRVERLCYAAATPAVPRRIASATMRCSRSG